jgi:transposase-like protein|tara:strand:+ start:216 stop:440 length:225 start_codon:yes stop_codon:yes gene_type:complete
MPGQKEEMKTAQLLQELHQRGVSYQRVADNLGVNWRTVHRWANNQNEPTIVGLINRALGQMLADELAENTAVLA